MYFPPLFKTDIHSLPLPQKGIITIKSSFFGQHDFINLSVTAKGFFFFLIIKLCPICDFLSDGAIIFLHVFQYIIRSFTAAPPANVDSQITSRGNAPFSFALYTVSVFPPNLAV